MPNHLHFAIKLKSETELKAFYRAKGRKIVIDNGADAEITPEQLKRLNSKQFANLFSSFTQSTNRNTQKKGGLFERPFKRKRVFDRAYVKRLIIYVHRNPIHHGFCTTFDDWFHSSWWSLIFDEEETWLQRSTVFNVFESKQGFLEQHQEHLDDFNDMLLFDD
jgi:putative transposase